MPGFILIRPTVWPQCTNVTDRQTDRQDNRLIAQGEPFYKRLPKTGQMGIPGEVWFFQDTSLKILTVPENPGRMVTLFEHEELIQPNTQIHTDFTLQASFAGYTQLLQSMAAREKFGSINHMHNIQFVQLLDHGPTATIYIIISSVKLSTHRLYHTITKRHFTQHPSTCTKTYLISR